MKDLLVGRRAVYTHYTRPYDEQSRTVGKLNHMEFRGVIVALVVVGQNNYPAVIMLYDNGTLHQHDIGAIMIEGEQSEAYR